MRSQIRREVLRIVKFYSAQYCTKLPKRPFILFSWNQRKSSQVDVYQGDSPCGTISFAFTVSEWKSPTTDNKGRLVRMIAHDLAHQWNSGLHLPV